MPIAAKSFFIGTLRAGLVARPDDYFVFMSASRRK